MFSLFEKSNLFNCFGKLVFKQRTNVNEIGNFETWNWENTSRFTIKNEADFLPQLEGSDGLAYHFDL